MKKLFFLSICLSFSLPLCWAQQTSIFSIYRDHWNVLNPAAISNNHLINEQYLSIGASFRTQWFKLEDAPNTQLINVEYIPNDYNQLITGGHIIRHQTGLMDQIGLYGQFAYRAEMGRRTEQALVFGLNAGIVQYRARIHEIEFVEEEVSGLKDDKVIYPDFSIGAFYYYSDLLYAGLSIPQTFGLSTVFRDTLNNEFAIKRVQHFYGVVGGYIPVAWFGTEASFLEPSIWLRYVPNSPLSFDVNVRYQISDFFWTGLGAGSGTGQDFSMRLHLEAGMVLGETVGLVNSQFKVGFGFDIPLGKFRQAFGNAVEVNVIYSLY